MGVSCCFFSSGSGIRSTLAVAVLYVISFHICLICTVGDVIIDLTAGNFNGG